MWAETGDFRDNSHNSMGGIGNSIDLTQLHFQSTSNVRNKRDRKNDGKYNLKPHKKIYLLKKCYIHFSFL